MSGINSELSLKSVYHNGHRALPQKRVQPVSVPQTVDLGAILDCPNPKPIIEGLSSQVLYHSLKVHGAEDYLDVIPHINNEQFIRLMDYDVWTKDELDIKKIFGWLSLCKQHGSEELVKKFRDLDEEYQIATLEGLVEVFDEEQYESLPDALQDGLVAFPGQQLWYRILTSDEKIMESVQVIIDSAIEVDIGYAMSLLMHAYCLPPNETKAQLQKFRKARLEEDGYISYEEAQRVFLPVDVKYLMERASKIRPDNENDKADLINYNEFGEGESFIDSVMRSGMVWWSDEQQETVKSSFAYLANAVCSAVDIEPDDLDGLKRVMDQIRGTMSLSLQSFTHCNANVAAELLVVEHPQILFRAGLTLVRDASLRVMDRAIDLELPMINKIMGFYKAQKWGEALNLVDVAWMGQFDFEFIEMFKGLINRFPMYPESTIEKEGVEKVLFTPMDSITKLEKLEIELLRRLGENHGN